MVLVTAPIVESSLISSNIRSILQYALTTARESIFNTKKTLEWLTEFIFDKLKWIPVAALIGIVTTLFKHPLEFITRVLCALIISVFFVFYIVLTFPPFSWVAFAVWFFFKEVLVLIGFTIVSVVIFVFVAIFYGVIAIINSATGGKLNKLALCQTSPTAWFTIPNYHYGNKYERGFFCSKPCYAGFIPDDLTGSFCERGSLAQPSYCPQAEIMRLLLKKNAVGERHVYANYIITPSYLMKNPLEKEEDYISHFDQMQQFQNRCKQKLGTFEDISLNICACLDAIQKSKNNQLSEATIKKLKEVCKQGFCNSKSRHVFCGSFADSEPEQKGDGLIKSLIYLLVAFVLFAFLMIYTYRFVQACTK
jgi:hypothetical protein